MRRGGSGGSSTEAGEKARTGPGKGEGCGGLLDATARRQARDQARSRDRDPQSAPGDRKSTRLNSSHSSISYAVFCLKKKKNQTEACEASKESAFTRWGGVET